MANILDQKRAATASLNSGADLLRKSRERLAEGKCDRAIRGAHAASVDAATAFALYGNIGDTRGQEAAQKLLEAATDTNEKAVSTCLCPPTAGEEHPHSTSAFIQNLEIDGAARPRRRRRR